MKKGKHNENVTILSPLWPVSETSSDNRFQKPIMKIGFGHAFYGKYNARRRQAFGACLVRPALHLKCMNSSPPVQTPAPVSQVF